MIDGSFEILILVSFFDGMSISLLLLLLLQLHLLSLELVSSVGLDVGVEEEVSKESKVAEIHEERVEDVVVADVTGGLGRVLLCGVGDPVDVAAEAHLNDLKERDELGDGHWHWYAHRF